MVSIANDFIQVSINSKGAELCSLVRKDTGAELLWQADATYWNRHAPILFPFVGRLKNNSFSYQGKNYPMGQHGFVRDELFVAENLTETSCQFILESNEKTLQLYPFHFRLTCEYALQKNNLVCSYKVLNTGNTSLFFSLGMHPGFICPLADDENLTDYALVFDQAEHADRRLLKDGIFTGETAPAFSGHELPLTEALFAADALVFKNLKSSAVLLRSSKHNHTLLVSFPGFPYLGIWKKPDARFICIEPWHGLADHITHSGNIEEKEGIKQLHQGEIFETNYTITIN